MERGTEKNQKMLKMLVGLGIGLDSEAKSLRRERGGKFKVYIWRKEASTFSTIDGFSTLFQHYCLQKPTSL
jgi:hypothetical protein